MEVKGKCLAWLARVGVRMLRWSAEELHCWGRKVMVMIVNGGSQMCKERAVLLGSRQGKQIKRDNLTDNR
jgi:hypothetical protein